MSRFWNKTQREAARVRALASNARRKAAGLPVGRPRLIADEAEWKANKRAQMSANTRRYRLNPERRAMERASNRKSRLRPEAKKRAAERWREWRRKNPEKAAAIAHRAWVKGQKDPAVVAARKASARKSYQRHKVRWRFYHHLRRTRKRQDCVDLVYTAREWAEAVKARFEAHGNRCVRCRSEGPLEADHVVPLARGGSHLPSNIQPLCGPCNRSKGARFSG